MSNYRITISNGKNELSRFYEESAFTSDPYYLADQITEIKQVLDNNYPANWDKKEMEEPQGDFDEPGHVEDNYSIEK